jgi:ABC-type polysaccharide/polyol phosphate transport system ATPase subunit
MTAPVIRVESLSKRYHIGTRQSYDTLRERLVAAAAEPWRRLRRFGRSSEREQDTIWALKDVSFEVQPGEVVGIIGRNGAGKSTLLKILTRITEPTCGRAELHGRVGSLLEVGTGFHPELTGRENIFLSGAILGMTSQEIRSQFDAIIDFSGIEKFIDTPVKRYSSGMHVRLGFAIAAHLQPEILLVDEVLAVGDAEFQRKCLGKMGDVAKGGRTVLFVSHNMGAVQKLCHRSVWLSGGHIHKDGHTPVVVDAYQGLFSDLSVNPRARLDVGETTARSDNFVLIDVVVSSYPNVGEHTCDVDPNRGLSLAFRCLSKISLDEAMFSIAVVNDQGVACIWERINGKEMPGHSGIEKDKEFTLTFYLPGVPLARGLYNVNFMSRYAGSLKKLCHYKGVAPFQVTRVRETFGVLAVPVKWELVS